jgi:hypothetical protein
LFVLLQASIITGREDAPQSKPSNSEGSRGSGGLDQSEEYKVGDKVRYWSATHNKWIDTCVHKIHRGPDGEIIKFDLSARSMADLSQVRKPCTSEDAPAPGCPAAVAVAEPDNFDGKGYGRGYIKERVTMSQTT